MSKPAHLSFPPGVGPKSFVTPWQAWQLRLGDSTRFWLRFARMTRRVEKSSPLQTALLFARSSWTALDLSPLATPLWTRLRAISVSS